ncbi:S8 family serine peptidase [Paenibacillus sp. TAB 01]|uniref:S8 family serine peptidase n=1 Tax=Paenibacillus sp. TAB 01 TaxID=3368988 RepID=UPI0037524A36
MALRLRRSPSEPPTTGAPFASPTTGSPAFHRAGPGLGGVKKPDLLAPGVGIVSLRASGSLLDRTTPRGRLGKSYIRLSGTSMAAPLIAGAAALLLQKRPGLSPARVKQELKARAFPLRFAKTAAGAGELNVRPAAARAARRQPPAQAKAKQERRRPR